MEVDDTSAAQPAVGLTPERSFNWQSEASYNLILKSFLYLFWMLTIFH